MADRIGTFEYLSGTVTVSFQFGEDFEVRDNQQSNLQVTPLFRSNNAAWSYGRNPYTKDFTQIWRKFSATGTTQSDIEQWFESKRQAFQDKSGTLAYEASDGSALFSEAGWYMTVFGQPTITASENGSFWVAEYQLTFIKP